MYFKTNVYEYRSRTGDVWERRKIGQSKWKYISARFWKKLKSLRQMSSLLRNRRSTLAEHVRIKLNRTYDEQTKKTTKYAMCGVPLDSLIVHNK